MAERTESGSYNSNEIAEDHPDDSDVDSMPKFGLILATGGVFLTSVAYIIKDRTIYSNKTNLFLWEHAIHALIIIPYISRIRNSIEVSRSSWKFVTLAGLLSSVANLLAIYSSYITPFSDKIFIIHSDSIIVAFLAWCFLKEVLSFYDAFTISISIIGLILATTPLFIFHPHSLIFQKHALRLEYIHGTVSTLGICLLVSITNVIIRFVRECPTSVIIAVQSLLSVLFSFIVCLNYNELEFPSSTNYWIIIVLISLLTLSGKLAFMYALKYDYAFRITMVSTLSVPLAILFGGFSKNIDLKMVEIGGFGMMVLSIILLFSEKTLKNIFRKYCGISAVQDYDNVEESSFSEDVEEPTLKKLLSREQKHTLYSTD